MNIKAMLSFHLASVAWLSSVGGERLEKIFNVTTRFQNDSSPLVLSIAVNPSYLAIGTPSSTNDGTSNGNGIIGAVQVYSINPEHEDQYELSHEVTGEDSGVGGGDEFGRSVALSQKSNTLVVGAPGASTRSITSGTDTATEYQYGYFQILRRESGGWQKMYVGLGKQYMDDNMSERLGECVTIVDDGSVVAVSAPGGNSNLGRVETIMYDCLTDQWIGMGDIEGPGASTNFGSALDLVRKPVAESSQSNGNGKFYLAVGSSEYTGTKGLVRIYHYDKTGFSKWSQLGDDIIGEAAGDFLGHDVSLAFKGQDLLLAVAIPSRSDRDLGRIQIYKFVDEEVPSWRKFQTIDTMGNGGLIDTQIQFSLDGMRLAVSSPRTDIGRGTVRILEYRQDRGRYELETFMQGKNRGFFGASFGYSESASLAIASPKNRMVELFVVPDENAQYEYARSENTGCPKEEEEGKDQDEPVRERGNGSYDKPDSVKGSVDGNSTFVTIIIVIAVLAAVALMFFSLIKVAKRNGFRGRSLWKAIPGSEHKFTPVSRGPAKNNVAFPVPSPSPAVAIEMGSFGVGHNVRSPSSHHSSMASPIHSPSSKGGSVRSANLSPPQSQSSPLPGNNNPSAISSPLSSASANSPRDGAVFSLDDSDNKSESEESYEILRQLS